MSNVPKSMSKAWVQYKTQGRTLHPGGDSAWRERLCRLNRLRIARIVKKDKDVVDAQAQMIAHKVIPHYFCRPPHRRHNRRLNNIAETATTTNGWRICIWICIWIWGGSRRRIAQVISGAHHFIIVLLRVSMSSPVIDLGKVSRACVHENKADTSDTQNRAAFHLCNNNKNIYVLADHLAMHV